MSLKVFHFFFISMSALMCFGIGAMRAFHFMNVGGGASLAQAIVAVLAGVGLLVYGVKFMKKYRELSYL